MSQEHIEELTRARKLVGELSPIIVDFDGEILAGNCRQKAGFIRRYQVDSRKLAEKWNIPLRVAKDRITLSSNIQRSVPRKETQAVLLRMAKAFEDAGSPQEEIALMVADNSPYKRSYVWELLPDEYKRSEKVEAGRMGASARLNRAEIEPRVIKPPPKESWEYRRARMKPPVSKMDEAVLLELQKEGIQVDFQKEFCLVSTRPEYHHIPTNTVIYLDGAKVHLKRQDRDEHLRGLLAKRFGVRVVSLTYKSYSERAKREIVEKIKEALRQRYPNFNRVKRG